MKRATVPRAVSPARMASGDHACLGFDDDNIRWKIRATFAEAGLLRGEQVIFFADAGGDGIGDAGFQQTADRLIGQGLRGAAIALDRGQILVIPDWPPQWETLTQGALHGGYVGIRATADMAWCARPDKRVDSAELVDYEAGLTPVLTDIGLTAICEYDRRLFPPDILGRVAAAHPASVPERPDALRVRRTERVLCVDGEADFAASADFEYALKLGPPPEHLDLTGLTFMDAYCAGLVLRLAVAACGGNGTGRSRLVVHCSPLVARMLRLCGAETVPQLDLREQPRRCPGRP
jgi:hypothetical protein